MSEIAFTKMHGNGNDFILIDEFREKVIPASEKAAFARRFCDRHFGIGADGVLFLGQSGSADIAMEIFNADGSRAEMCGNGIRCLAKHAFDAGYVGEGACAVETDAGILGVVITPRNGVWVKVNMGKPLFTRKDIPALGEGEFIEVELHGHRVSAVNTGVPHAVIF
ncbi:MAG TPA: diaminopimelate epimerase, partial [Candidatus Methanoperedenaceae archaeon]|nr:diaminopimelate epimerase [Candidatus Methanoperedenaceae archaeon]